jgi:hypothetical protein
MLPLCQALTAVAVARSPSAQITVDNKVDPGCSTIIVAGPGQQDCLLLLVNGLFSEGYKVLSSNYK